MNNLFHLAFPVKDLEESRKFYGEILGCEEGRSSEAWIDFNLFGHQIVAHLAPGASGARTVNEVDADHVPVPHFGIVLPPEDFHKLAERLKSKGVQFVIEPKVRFRGEIGEQATMFFLTHPVTRSNSNHLPIFRRFSQNKRLPAKHAK